MFSLARQLPQNQEQMAGRLPNPSFGSDCPGEKGSELPGGVRGAKGSHFTLEKGEKQHCPLHPTLFGSGGCLGDPSLTPRHSAQRGREAWRGFHPLGKRGGEQRKWTRWGGCAQLRGPGLRKCPYAHCLAERAPCALCTGTGSRWPGCGAVDRGSAVRRPGFESSFNACLALSPVLVGFRVEAGKGPELRKLIILRCRVFLRQHLKSRTCLQIDTGPLFH